MPVSDPLRHFASARQLRPLSIAARIQRRRKGSHVGPALPERRAHEPARGAG